jgi:hypothetical protein
MTKWILMSLDVEEFDIPEEYGQVVNASDKIKISSEGLRRVLDLFDKLDITITCFTTVNFAQNQPQSVKRIIKKHELASHGYFHSKFHPDNLRSSRLELERLSGKKVYGFRQPRFEAVDERELFSAGYVYNSSENPIWLPGRYMNLFRPRLPYLSNDILNLPISTSPLIRYPLFWLSFKNSPLWLFKCMSRWALETDGCVNIFFHPWEFNDLSHWRLPIFIKRSSGIKMLAKLEEYLIWLKPQAEFIPCSSFADMFLKRDKL